MGKKKLIYENVESLQPIVNVVNDAADALNNKNKTIRESSLPEAAFGAIGAGIGSAGSFAALYGLGTVGLSGAGIMSGLAAAGAIVGGGAVVGIFVLAAPIAILGGIGVAIGSNLKHKQLKQQRERLYKIALEKNQAIIKALKNETDANEDRIEYLKKLNIMLQSAVNDLKKDIELDK